MILQEDIFNFDGLPLLWRFCRASIQPDLSPQFLHLALDSSITTLAYAVCGTFLSIVLGIILGVFSSQVWWLLVLPQARISQSSVWLGMRGLLAFPRAIHEAIWGLFFVNIWGLDPLSAIFAIAIPYGAIVAKVFSEILDETPRKPLFALIGSGVAPWTAFIYSLVPQAFFNLLSYSFYRFECSIRSAAVLGIIGAGGLGYQLSLSLQSLRYEQLWTFFYALVLLNGLVDTGSAWLRRRLGCPSRLDLNSGKLSRGGKGGFWLIGVLSIAVVLVSFCFWYVSADFSKLWSERTGELLADMGKELFPLEINKEILTQLWQLSGETLAMSLLAIALAGVGGILLSFPAARNFFLPGGLFASRTGKGLGAWLLFLGTRILLLFCRAIPGPIWALVALFVMFPGILPGAIALAMHNLGILGRLMAEVTENLPREPLLALKGQGTPAGLVFLYGVLPATISPYVAYILYRWEVCLRETVIVGIVGAGGLGRLLEEQRSSFDYSGILVTLGCFIVLTFGVDLISGLGRRKGKMSKKSPLSKGDLGG